MASKPTDEIVNDGSFLFSSHALARQLIASDLKPFAAHSARRTLRPHVLRELVPQFGSNFVIALADMAVRDGKAFQVGDCFYIPNNHVAHVVHPSLNARGQSSSNRASKSAGAPIFRAFSRV
jgi:hypothetical protein